MSEVRGQTQRPEAKKPSRWAVRQGRKLHTFEAPYSPCRHRSSGQLCRREVWFFAYIEICSLLSPPVGPGPLH